MAKFPVQYTERTLPGRAAAVRADIDVRTGAQELALAAAGIGEALANIGLRFDVMEGKAQADTAEMDAKLSWRQTVDELRGEDDVSKWDAAFNAHKERVAGLVPKNRRGARQFNTTINRLTPIWQERFTGLKSAKLDDNMKAASFVKRNDLMKSATRETMPLVIQKIETELEVLDRLSPSVSREETEIAKTRVERDVQFSIAQREALRTPEAMLATIKGDRIEGFDALEPDDIMRIRRIANSSATQAKAAIRELQERTAIEYSGRVAGAKTPDDANLLMQDIDRDIANGRLDRKVGEGYKRELIKGPQVPTDWDVHSQLLLDIEAVRDGTKDFLDVYNEIQSHRANDINGPEIGTLTNAVLQARDKGGPANTDVGKHFFQMLKEAETDRIFSMDKTTNSMVYGPKYNQLLKYFTDYRKKNAKDPTFDEAQKFYDGLVVNYRKPESPFTEARVQQMLGEIQSGGAVSIYGVVMPFRSAEDAINHALRTLGPDWQTISPKTAEIIKQKWPEAKIEVRAVKPEAKITFQTGERRIHPNGGLYEYTGLSGDKAWRLITEE